MQFCSGCKTSLPLTAYHLGQRRCIACKKGNRAARRASDPVGHRARERAYRISRGEAERRYQREWKRKRRATDPAGDLAYARAYRANHRSERARYTRTWRMRHPDSYKAWGLRHYAARKGARVRLLSSADIAAMLREQEGRCAYCRLPLGDPWHLDHKIPLSRGGHHDRENVCASCPTCNMCKYNKTAGEFLVMRGTVQVSSARAEGV